MRRNTSWVKWAPNLAVFAAAFWLPFAPTLIDRGLIQNAGVSRRQNLASSQHRQSPRISLPAPIATWRELTTPLGDAYRRHLPRALARASVQSPQANADRALGTEFGPAKGFVLDLLHQLHSPRARRELQPNHSSPASNCH